MNILLWGWDSVVNKDVAKDIEKTVKNFIQSESEVNFYFPVMFEFEELCAEVISTIKKKNRDKKITMTYITRKKHTMTLEEEREEKISKYGFDDVILYPYDLNITDEMRINYSVLHRKIRNWCLSFVDVVLTNFYPSINPLEIQNIERLNKSNLKILNFYNKYTDEKLQNMILKDYTSFELKIYENTKLKIPFTVTAKELNTYPAKVSYTFYWNIHRTLRRYKAEIKKE